MNQADAIYEFIKTDLLDGLDIDFDHKTSLFRNNLIDSVNLVQLSVFLEDEFQIKVESQDIVPDNIDSIEKLVKFIERKRGK